MSGTKVFILTEKSYKALITRGMDLRCKCTIGGVEFDSEEEAQEYGAKEYGEGKFTIRKVEGKWKVFDGPCNMLLVPHDEVLSKPSKKGRKYYLLEHYERMHIKLNGNGDNGS